MSGKERGAGGSAYCIDQRMFERVNNLVFDLESHVGSIGRLYHWMYEGDGGGDAVACLVVMCGLKGVFGVIYR